MFCALSTVVVLCARGSVYIYWIRFVYITVLLLVENVVRRCDEFENQIAGWLL